MWSLELLHHSWPPEGQTTRLGGKKKDKKRQKVIGTWVTWMTLNRNTDTFSLFCEIHHISVSWSSSGTTISVLKCVMILNRGMKYINHLAKPIIITTLRIKKFSEIFFYVNSKWVLPLAAVELSWSECVGGHQSGICMALAGLFGAPLGWFSFPCSSKS